MSDAILADFKEVDSSQFAPPVEMPPAPAIAADDGLTLEVDPDVVELPAVMVQERNPAESLTRELVTVPPGPGFGTGITEYRGRKFSLLTKRILFIPVAFKLAW